MDKRTMENQLHSTNQQVRFDAFVWAGWSISDFTNLASRSAVKIVDKGAVASIVVFRCASIS